jgi:hypothetical protein
MLFSLSTDPLGLFTLELFRGAKLAVFLGIIVWYGDASVIIVMAHTLQVLRAGKCSSFGYLDHHSSEHIKRSFGANPQLVASYMERPNIELGSYGRE